MIDHKMTFVKIIMNKRYHNKDRNVDFSHKSRYPTWVQDKTADANEQKKGTAFPDTRDARADAWRHHRGPLRKARRVRDDHTARPRAAHERQQGHAGSGRRYSS